MALITAPATWQTAGDVAPIAVVIDVLRWSTSVLTALHHGAERVEAFATPELARARVAELGDAILAGERESHRIPGFALGNSPLEYTRAAVQGRVLLSTTTNGTQALLAASRAERVLIGAFVNLNAVVGALRTALGEGRSVTLLCAGQAGVEALEDSACAGAIVHALRLGGGLERHTLAPSAERAEQLWLAHDGDVNRVFAVSAHAQSLRTAGYAADLVATAMVSSIALVGPLDSSSTGRDIAVSAPPPVPS